MRWFKKWIRSGQELKDDYEWIDFEINRQRAEIMAAAQKDIRETMKDDLEERAEELAKEKISALLSVFDERMIVTYEKGMRSIYIGGEKADEGTLGNLKSEAEMLMSMNLWQIIYETPKKLAQKALFEDDGDNKVTHTKGRAMLYMLDTQKRIIETFRSYTPPK